MKNEPRALHWLKVKWPVPFVWLVTALLMGWMDGSVDLANQALLLVLASALCGLWLSAWESLLVCALAVMAFNWQFVPPRGTLTVDLRQHVWLLFTMLGVGSVVAWVTARQRTLAQMAQAMAAEARMLHGLGEQLRGQPPQGIADALANTLSDLAQAPCFVSLRSTAIEPATEWTAGAASTEERAHVDVCVRNGQPSETALAAVHGHDVRTLPLRGPTRCVGAAVVRLDRSIANNVHGLATAQALCDQTALHWERTEADALRQQAQQEAQAQAMRNTLLSAISHDYRTPLATILGAASSLLTQSDRLTAAQARALAQTIVDEVDGLRDMTDNTLELSRLDAATVQIHRDWESLEELMGSAVARARIRHPSVRIHSRVAPAMPLLRCDATLVVQLLNNLVDNAVKYGLDGQPVEIVARPVDDDILLTVADRGPGIPAALRERIFRAFERGPKRSNDSGPIRGAGLGLALCRAIMVAHQGTITPRMRQRGGTCMECRFPLEVQPVSPGAEGVAP